MYDKFYHAGIPKWVWDPPRVRLILCLSPNQSPAQRRPSAPLHGIPRHELVSAVCPGSRLSAFYEAKGPNPPGPQTPKVSLFMSRQIDSYGDEKL